MKDLRQAFIGAFASVLFFFAIRQGAPIEINPQIGFFMGGLWLFLFYRYNGRSRLSEKRLHFAVNLALVVAVTHIMAVAFGVSSAEAIQSFEYFGSASWVAVWMALPLATLYDKRNIGNILDRYYSRR